MKIAKIPFAVWGLQYQILRVPLQLIENRLAARMGAEAPARLFYERSLGMLDATMGRVLGDATLTRRGSALAERADTLSRAARLDEAATQKQQRADAELKAARAKAVQDQRQAGEAREAEVQDARTEARTAQDRRSAGRREAHHRGETAGGRSGCSAQECGRRGQARGTGQHPGR